MRRDYTQLSSAEMKNLAALKWIGGDWQIFVKSDSLLRQAVFEGRPVRLHSPNSACPSR